MEICNRKQKLTSTRGSPTIPIPSVYCCPESLSWPSALCSAIHKRCLRSVSSTVQWRFVPQQYCLELHEDPKCTIYKHYRFLWAYFTFYIWPTKIKVPWRMKPLIQPCTKDNFASTETGTGGYGDVRRPDLSAEYCCGIWPPQLTFTLGIGTI